MERVIFDANIYNILITDQEFYQLYIKAIDLNLIKQLITHVDFDQIKAIPDSKKDLKNQFLMLISKVGSTTETLGHIEGLSKLGWSTVDPNGINERVIGNQVHNNKNKYDALLASTASQLDLFVTNDHRLLNKCKELNIRRMTSYEFKLYLIKKISDIASSVNN